MNKRKLVTIGGVALIVLVGATRGYSYVRSTITEYQQVAPCGRLAGVPGLLQSAGFIPQGDCTVGTDGGCHDSRACTVKSVPSGAPTKGHCTTVIVKKQKTCGCM
jgi:hypothetical protein